MKEQEQLSKQNLILLLTFLTTAVVVLTFTSTFLIGWIARIEYGQEIQNTNR